MIFLVLLLPSARRFFATEAHGGYTKSTPLTDALQHPACIYACLLIWLLAACAIAVGCWTMAASALNLLLSRYFFVRLRWRSILRGMGAPGFMTYWLAGAMLVMEVGRAEGTAVFGLALLVLQIDLALIMASSGVYKATSGYPRNEGMELGLVNPEWGYWWRFYAKLPPAHVVFKVMNQLAWSTEILGALLLAIPPTRTVGSLVFLASFAFIATQIRLGVLCEMVMVSSLIFIQPGTLPDRLLAAVVSALRLRTASPGASLPEWSATLVTILLWAFLAALPLAHGGLFYNFYARRRLPGTLQRVLERYTNFFGIIIWRVFSVDIINFFVLIHRVQPNGSRELVSHWGERGFGRYGHVAESITVTSLFTTLKYYPSNRKLFEERLLRYAKTLDYPNLIFEYVEVRKTAGGFEHAPVAEFQVDVPAMSITERQLSETGLLRKPHQVSPVHEGKRPGSYAPA